ncbi:MAG TPA: SPOR domain-containing protein [Allosphingosinicella sp.]|nr:SPOR domain-containing protein [Allosphingosinicella sp.]
MKLSGRPLIAVSAAAAILLVGTVGYGAAAPDVKSGIDRWMAQDYEGAVAQWRPLADQGNADAQFNLGQAYKLGRGVPVDLRLAQSWYQKAAQQGHEQAQVNVGLLLYNSGKRQEALPWIRKAVELGDPRAQYILGTELFNGDLVAKDWPKAYGLMLLAADSGLPPAADNIEAMNRFIPLPEREKGRVIAEQMRRGSVQTAAARPPRTPNAAGPAHVPSANSALQSPVAAQAPVRTASRPVQSAAPVAAAGGGWRVQLGAFSSAANAQRAWAGLRARVGALGPLSPRYVPAGAVTRLQAGPIASRAAADRVCAAAKAAGTGCFPVAP